QESDGSWVVDAAAHVEELEELFDVEFGERDYDTVGGLVVSGFGRVPNVGESMISHGLNVEVLMADHRRVRKVRVRRDSSEQKATGGA
ncbi:MAG TPA: transporter associated domain-containing protein, partial [Candidatus Polarisedimenticolaceae bacterium]|nr:transporter associated domain-containing protein [Candidatus Polarisedimenticolaceae bacterium]